MDKKIHFLIAVFSLYSGKSIAIFTLVLKMWGHSLRPTAYIFGMCVKRATFPARKVQSFLL